MNFDRLSRKDDVLGKVGKKQSELISHPFVNDGEIRSIGDCNSVGMYMSDSLLGHFMVLSICSCNDPYDRSFQVLIWEGEKEIDDRSPPPCYPLRDATTISYRSMLYQRHSLSHWSAEK